MSMVTCKKKTNKSNTEHKINSLLQISGLSFSAAAVVLVGWVMVGRSMVGGEKGS